MATQGLRQCLFQPRGIALVGASGDPSKHTARPLRYLRQHGFVGRVFVVNPRRNEVLGETAYPSVAAAPGPIDQALIMVPARAVPDAVSDCAAAGVPVVSVYSDGFAEAGAEGVEKQRALVALAREVGVRLLGPNSMGVISVQAAMPLSVNAALETPRLIPGDVGVVSQSGTMLGALLSRGQARGMGFSRLISVGNEADVGVGELLDCLVDDVDTGAILLFLETIRDCDGLASAAHRAHRAGKPVIAYKLGRSSIGQALARSHSGAMTGGAETARAFFRAHGIVQVDTFETLLEISPLLRAQAAKPRRRVSVLTTTGGGSATVVDRLGLLGVETVPAPPALVADLAEEGIDVGTSPVVDLTMAGARPEIYARALRSLLAAPDIDVVVAVVGSSGQFQPEVAVKPIVESRSGKPLAVFIVPQADASLRLLHEAGIAAFRTPEACADAVRALLDWRAPVSETKIRGDLRPVAERLSRFRQPELHEAEAGEVLELLGIQRPASRILAGPVRESPIGYPVAVKALARGLTHKTEVGAVYLDVTDDEALGRAVAAVSEGACRQLGDEALEGILLQRMERGVAEALVSYRFDAEVGPVVTLGVGGTLTEIVRDLSIRLAPVGRASALEMIDEVKGLASVRGYRGQPPGDHEALADAVVAMSDLARLDGPEVLEAEINPLIVKPAGEGVVAVDAVLTLNTPRDG